MGLLNCWNWKNCGRYPGGPKAEELGVCPAAEYGDADGFLGGRGAGRGCAFLAGTLCGGNVQGSFADKVRGCQSCDYYQALRREFGAELNLRKYQEYCRKPGSGKEFTPAERPWVARGRHPEMTARRARKNYARGRRV